MSAILTALPFPTRPWETAKAQFLEQLTPEEKQCFESATLENIFYQTSAAQKRHANGSNSWAMQERISSLVDAIEEYGKALDVYANAFPLVLSPLWGSIRVILKIAGETGRFQEKIVDMLASIGDALPRFQIYEILFRNHERLLKAISTAYLDVLRFCVKAKQFFGHGKKLPLPMSIGCRGLWKPFRQEFDKYMSDFRKHRKHVEKEASLAHMIESARRREIELANHALQKRNGMVNKRHRYMSLLQVVDYQSKQKTLANLRFQGTNTWLQASTPYMEWLNSPISTCLCCYGIPGSGKSVLASSVVDMLGQINEPSSILCYYYFDHADVRSLDMNYLLGSLIRQVLTNLPLTEFGDDSEIPMDDYASISLGEKLRLYVKLLRRFPQAFIVLDGLDELGHDCQVSTLDLIKSLVQERLPVVRLYVTCREGEHLVRKTLRSHNSFKLSSPQVSSDISLFIEGALDSAANHNPILSNLQLHKEVRDALLHGANGM
ncbi:uncharacterized protein EI97DRAFT_484903 [Westerdykella ornata]|uniref:NACHT domain-containing protein n=1 Tax=Westerdykella ornata TaxID=318751 RepID=A0A6A6JR96_WESOR|nr:uncharacterized protein EI97DRAFT_484903 [Westerdykella ornata]KAF2279072.1 hypothetical protein EI97DRAFT_484903 [Westerdykella ornata]